MTTGLLKQQPTNNEARASAEATPAAPVDQASRDTQPVAQQQQETAPEQAKAAPASKGTPKSAREENTGLGARVGAFLFFVTTAVALIFGRLIRDESYLTAEAGLGYALGIVGATLMVLLLTYPLRKRFKFMRNTGPVRHWFRVHMIMGVLGPVAILFHANFQLGSTNSNIALITMLVVAGSGLIGRYMYTKIHYGLYGGRITLNALKEDTEEARAQLSSEFAFAPQIRGRLKEFEEKLVTPARSPIHATLRLLTLGIRIRWTRRQLRAFMKHAITLRARQAGWDAKESRTHQRDGRRYLNAYLGNVRKVVELGFYERIFSFWHVLHFPLFIMLAFAGIVHVFAVHVY